MQMAERFHTPVITLIDTQGAYPGLGAEERGQSEALARNILEMSVLRTPIISVVIGEGGSGGALALGVSDRILMFENSVYSVITPEGFAAILWKDSPNGNAPTTRSRYADDLPDRAGRRNHSLPVAEALDSETAGSRGAP